MSHHFDQLFSNFLRRPGANHDDIQRACSALDLQPPADYLAALEFTNGGEGFIGSAYFRFYSMEELLSLNHTYQVSRFTPGLVIFGSTGQGEAYAWDTRQARLGIVQVPFSPLDVAYAELVGNDFSAFLLALAETVNGSDSTDRPEIDLSAVGKEVHQRTPIAFGGDPLDPQNIVRVPCMAHAEICTFWNDVYQSKKAERAK